MIAIAEISEKTQLFRFILAPRFKRPLYNIARICVATFVNHFQF